MARAIVVMLAALLVACGGPEFEGVADEFRNATLGGAAGGAAGGVDDDGSSSGGGGGGDGGSVGNAGGRQGGRSGGSGSAGAGGVGPSNESGTAGELAGGAPAATEYDCSVLVLWRADQPLSLQVAGLVVSHGNVYRALVRVTYALPECDPFEPVDCDWFELAGVCA